MHRSAYHGPAEICDLLIKKAPLLIDALDGYYENSALHYAAQGGKIEAVKVLLKHGAIIDLKNKSGKTPLDLANKQEIIDFLRNWKSE